MNKIPIIGQKYIVPCIFGTIANIGPHSIPADWWPVLLPSHEDSKYFPRYRTKWRDTGDEFIGVEEVYYRSDSTTPHHYHVDPRFTLDSMYTTWEVHNKSWHNTIRTETPLEYRELECTREMPIQRLFTGFGQRFIDDHKDKKMKCMKCPHKGTDLKSMPIINGVVTCPAHGLRFDCESGECLVKSLKD